MFESVQPKLNFIPSDEFIIEDLETLKVMADPLRLRIRELMVSPCTVKQIAAELDIPATKLYYHINLLEKHGLIVVVDAKIISGIIEKHYQVSAKMVRVANHLLSSPTDADESLELSINTLFDDTKVDLLTSIRDGAVNMDEDCEPHLGAKLNSLRLRLTEDEARAFFAQFEELMQTFINQSLANQQAQVSDMQIYKVLGVVFPTSRRETPKGE
jgi:DNA-binding transcriptional ArsR family regulator